MITRAGVLVPLSTDVRELSVVPASSFAGADPQPIDMFSKRPDGCIVPLHWAKSRFELTDARSPGSVSVDVQFVGDLRAEQRHVSSLISGAFREHGGCVVSMATGSGKTVVALHAACEARVKTLVVVHKNFLVDQWTSRISEFVPGARTTKIQGSEFDTSGDFVIATIQTLLSRAYSSDKFEEFGLAIFDEAHVIAARSFSKIALGICTPLTLGLTATPTRRDGLGFALNWFLGPNVYTSAVKQGADVRLKVSRYFSDAYNDPPPTNRRGDVCFTSMTTHLVADITRTRHIVDEIAWLAERDYDTLVLTHRRAHATAIAAIATSRGGIEIATYLGGDTVVPTAKVVVSTFALVAEGFDHPRFKGLVLATPASNVVQQAVGRVMRGSGRSIVVDIVDSWSLLHAMFSKRRKIYKTVGVTTL